MSRGLGVKGFGVQGFRLQDLGKKGLGFSVGSKSIAKLSNI